MRYLVLLGLVAGCASAPPAAAPVAADSVKSLVPEVKPRFVVVSRNTPLFFSPEDDSPALLYRDHAAQLEHDRKVAEKMQKYIDSRQERYAKEIKAEKKRIRKIKDREKRNEYATKRRNSRAKRHLQGLEKRVIKYADGHPAERYFSLAVLSENDTHFEVQNLVGDEETAHCYRRGLAGFGKAKLRFWVKKSDVETVTTQRESIEIWQGSSVATAAGVVVHQDNGKQTFMVDGYQIQTDGGLDSVGKVYSPSGTFEAPFTDTTFSEIAFAEGMLAFSRGQALAFNPWVDVYVTRTLWVGKRFYATTQTHCAEFTVHVPEEALVPVGRRAAMRLSGADAPASPPYIPRGTVISTLDGAEIGYSTGDLALGEEVEADANQRCFKKSVWEAEEGSNQRSITWCAPTDTIVNQ